MRIREITITEIKKNIKNNTKKMLIIFLVCVLVGGGVGAISATNYKPELKTDKSAIEDRIILEDLDESNPLYYKECFYVIKAKNDYLNAYVDYFDAVNLSPESREKIENFEADLIAYQDINQQAIKFYYETPLAVNGNREASINEVYTIELEEIQEKIKVQEELLNEVVNGNYAAEYKAGKQDIISEELIELKKEHELINNKIKLVQIINKTDLIANNEKADETIDYNVTEINNLIDRFNLILEEIAKSENYEIIFNKNLLAEYEKEAGINRELNEEDILNNHKEKAIIYAKSIEGLDVKKERFFAMFTFFTLFGIVIAGLYGAVHMAEKKCKNE